MYFSDILVVIRSWGHWKLVWAMLIFNSACSFFLGLQPVSSLGREGRLGMGQQPYPIEHNLPKKNVNDMLIFVDHLVVVHAVIVANGSRLWMTWLKIICNGAGAFILSLVLNSEPLRPPQCSLFLYTYIFLSYRIFDT